VRYLISLISPPIPNKPNKTTHPYKACHCVLREPSMLRGQYKGVPQREIFEILFATYGDPHDADLCVDVTGTPPPSYIHIHTHTHIHTYIHT
jgi:hypothetical protein